MDTLCAGCTTVGHRDQEMAQMKWCVHCKRQVFVLQKVRRIGKPIVYLVCTRCWKEVQ